MHTSIVSMHLATIGNNKILCTHPPHIIGSEEILPRLTRCTLAQLRTNKSLFLKSYLHKVDAKTHPSPLCPLCNTHTHISSSAPTYAPHTHHIVTPGFVDIPRRSDCTAGQIDRAAGWWTACGKIELPSSARVIGVGRQQHVCFSYISIYIYIYIYQTLCITMYLIKQLIWANVFGNFSLYTYLLIMITVIWVYCCLLYNSKFCVRNKQPGTTSVVDNIGI